MNAAIEKDSSIWATNKTRGLSHSDSIRASWPRRYSIKPDGRVDPGGPTSRALARAARTVPVPAAPPPAGEDDNSPSFFNSVVQDAKDLEGDAEDLGGKVIKAAKGLQ